MACQSAIHQCLTSLRNLSIMEIDAMLFWNVILTLVVVPFGWAFNKMFQEVKRLQILLNKTREEYARRDDVKEDMDRVMAALHRVEDKIDKMLSRDR